MDYSQNFIVGVMYYDSNLPLTIALHTVGVSIQKVQTYFHPSKVPCPCPKPSSVSAVWRNLNVFSAFTFLNKGLRAATLLLSLQSITVPRIVLCDTMFVLFQLNSSRRVGIVFLGKRTTFNYYATLNLIQSNDDERETNLSTNFRFLAAHN